MPLTPCHRGTALPSLKKEPKLYCRIYPPEEPLQKRRANRNAVLGGDSGETLSAGEYSQSKRSVETQKPATRPPLNRIVYDSMSSPIPNTLCSTRTKLENSISSQDNLTKGLELECLDVLVFESRFESGNLRRAMMLHRHEYDLIMQPDINTNKHTQWFFFRVSNTKTDIEYKFNIVNMMKPDSTFKFGSRLVMYSMKRAQHENIGWYRGGDNVQYFANEIKFSYRATYNTLSFTTKFEHEDDEVYIAMSYPYTYTDLQRDLRCLELSPIRSKFCRRRTLCTTLATNNCDILTVTDFSSSSSEFYHKKVVVISARVHPGESGSSFICKGIINYLTSTSDDAAKLRSKYVFKIIPMLNPDGVINGNYRCSLSGVDLNRQWISPSRNLHPTIYHLKDILMRESEEQKLVLFCDIHCHSRKFNAFMYGCSKTESVGNENVFPYLLHQSCKYFNYGDCYFGVEKQKESTGRIVVWKELDLTRSYTLECSFGGCDVGEHAQNHLNPDHLDEIGVHFCQSLLKMSELTEIGRKELKERIKSDNTFRAGSNFVDSDDESSAVLKLRKGMKSLDVSSKSALSTSRTMSRSSKRVSKGPIGKKSRGTKPARRHVLKISTSTISPCVSLENASDTPSEDSVYSSKKQALPKKSKKGKNKENLNRKSKREIIMPVVQFGQL